LSPNTVCLSPSEFTSKTSIFWMNHWQKNRKRKRKLKKLRGLNPKKQNKVIFPVSLTRRTRITKIEILVNKEIM
jgi:hypothetical protein